MRTRVGVFLAVLVMAVAWSTPAAAQTTGAIRGRVTDPDGQALPGVTVTVESDALIEGSRVMTTGGNGTYNFSGLPVGVYEVTVELSGFDTVSQEDVRVSLGTTSSVNFSMVLSAVAETITVTGQSPVVDITSSSVSTNFDAEFMEDLPTTRNFYDLIQAAPGMSNSWKQGTSDRTVAFGSNQQSNAWHIDGVNNTAPETGSSWVDVNPDAIAEIQVLGVGAPAEFGNVTGGAFNVITKRGSNAFHGSGSFFWQHDELTATNIELPDEDFPSFTRDYYREATATLGGPIAQDRVWFFGSLRYRRDAFAEPRTDPELAPVTVNDIYDLKITTRLNDNNFIDATVHYDKWDFPEAPTPFVTPSATTGERGTTPSWSAKYRGIFSENTFSEIKYAGWWADDFHLSRTGSLEPAFVDYTPPGGGPTTIEGGAWWPWKYITWHQQFSGDVSHYAQDFLGGDHDFKFGVQYSYGAYDTKVAAGASGTYYYHYYGYYYQVVQNPYTYGGRNQALGGFWDDSFTVNDRLTLNLGLRVDQNIGDIPDYPRLATTGEVGEWDDTSEIIPGVRVVDWLTVSPRIGFALTPTESGRTVVRGHFGVYYDGNVGGNWDAPTVNPPPYQLFWLPNGRLADGSFDLTDRELIFEAAGSDRSFDPDLKAPRTLQYSIGFEHELSTDYAFGAQYVHKDTENLVGWNIIDGVFDEVLFTDPFTGNVVTLFSVVETPTTRKSNGPGQNPEGHDQYWQKYHGLIFTFNKRWSDNWSMNASYTLSKSWGLIPTTQTSSQFNPPYGSTSGSDPNYYVNAEQRLQGDRPHMFRIQWNTLLPWDLDLTGVINVQSGRPFNRQIRVGGLGQGTSTVIMTPAGEVDDAAQFGRLRYPVEKRVDLAIGKRVQAGPVQLKFDGQIFNLLNEDTHTLHETLVLQAGDVFVPTDFFWPRRLQIRLGMEF